MGTQNNQIIAQECMDSFVTIEAGKNKLTPELLRKSISDIEQRMLEVPEEQKLALETRHHFADLVYCRTVFMKAGSLITGRIHAVEHVVVISQGRASVVCEERGSQELVAPMIFVSRAGVKRILFIHEDMIFTTVHQNPENLRDLDELEKKLILPDYELLKSGGQK
jgi:hypothetical protein